MQHLIFDIETVPDYAGLRRLILRDVPAAADVNAMTDDAVLLAYWKKRKPEEDDDVLRQAFMPIHLHRVVTIGLALWTADDNRFKLWSIAADVDSESPAADEASILQRFFDGIALHTPQLVSWNGSGFDLPVLHHRALIHGINAGRYWELGEQVQAFRYNNYLSRYHYRHLDLMDVLAAYNGKNFTKLDDMAKLCGMPGKHGMDGSEVASAFAAGKLPDIRRYCEADVLNTALLYFRYLKMTERLSPQQYQTAIDSAKDWVGKQTESFWVTLLEEWDNHA